MVAKPSTSPDIVLLTTSEETIGSYVIPITSFRESVVAFSIMLFISSMVDSFVISIVRSTVLPSGIGTVIEDEAILLFKKGRTFTITSEDFVILGIIFSPAALFSLKPSPATSAKRFEFE